MTSPDEPFDYDQGLPSLDDYVASKPQSGRRRRVGRPRLNPLATQQQVRKFQVEARARERAKLNDARDERKREIDDYVVALFNAHPDIQELLISIVQHVFEYARRDEDPLTEYDARTYVMRSVIGQIKHLTSREETIKFLREQHEAQKASVATVDEAPVAYEVAASDEDAEFEAMMAEGLPGGDYNDSKTTDGMMSYPKDWSVG